MLLLFVVSTEDESECHVVFAVTAILGLPGIIHFFLWVTCSVSYGYEALVQYILVLIFNQI